MDLEKEINKILFDLGKNVMIHKIDDTNSVIEIDYNEYTVRILKLFRDYLTEE
jgi:hypothetical protein